MRITNLSNTSGQDYLLLYDSFFTVLAAKVE